MKTGRFLSKLLGWVVFGTIIFAILGYPSRSHGAVYSDRDFVIPVREILQNTKSTEFIGLGDSNQVMNGYGWDAGWQKGLAQISPTKSTGLVSWLNSSGTNHAIGEGWQVSGDSPNFGSEPVPVWLQNLSLQTSIHRPQWNGTGSSIASTNHGVVLYAGRFDLSSEFRHYVLLAGNEPVTIAPTSRAFGTWQVLSTFADIVNFNTETNLYQATLPQSSLRQNLPGIEFRLNQYAQPQISSPYASLYTRVENRSLNDGVAYSTLYYLGGASARDCLETLQSQNPVATNLWFDALYRSNSTTGSTKRNLVVTISFGLNDRTESALSLGPNTGLVSSTPDGYRDNLEGIIDWFTARVDPSKFDLYFWLVPSHPISTPDDLLLVSYRSSARSLAIANPRVTEFSLDALVTHDDLVGMAGYFAPNDFYHLSPIGYDAIIQRLLNALVAESRTDACAGDWNLDKVVDVQDLALVLTHYYNTNTSRNQLISVLNHYGESCFATQHIDTN